jgi:tetratricopeptide (TPR) repeat protein
MKWIAQLLLLLLFSPLAAAAAEPSHEAVLAFSYAKLLADEGSFKDALEAFEKAAALAPDDPYVHSEYAAYLSRLAELGRSPTYRQEQLQRAVEQAEIARRLAPEDLDILQMVGDTYLSVVNFDRTDRRALLEAVTVLEKVRDLSPDAQRARMTLGQIYGARGEWGKAAQVFREVIQQSPRDRRAYDLLVEALLRGGTVTEAEAALQEILAFDPEDVSARLQWAELVGQRGDPQAALAILEAGPDSVRAATEARLLTAKLHYMAKDLDRALKELGALGEDGRSGVGGWLRANVLADQGKAAAAIEQLRSLLDQEPENSRVAATLAALLLEVGKNEEAAGLLAEMTKRLEAARDQDNAEELRLDWAGAVALSGDWAQALEILEPLTRSANSTLRARAGVRAAEALYRLERGEEALAMLESTGGKDPASIGRKADLLMRLGRQEEGETLARELGARQDEASILTAALLFQRSRQWQDAITLLQGHLARHPDSLQALYSLGAAADSAGRRGLAEETFRRILAVDPNSPDAMNYVGYSWAERGENLEEALSLIEKAVALAPDNGAYVDSLGWVYFQLGRHEEALTHLRRAAQLLPTNSVILEHLGDAHQALGESQAAREAYQRALEAGPENAERVREKLGQPSPGEEP